MKQQLLTFIIVLIASIASTNYALADNSLYQNAPDVPTFDFSPDFQVDGLYWKIVPGGVELTRATGNSDTAPAYELVSLTVPESVTYNGENYPVIGIGQGTFMRNKTIKEITFPEGLKSIGDRAFNQATIETLNFPTTLQVIGKRAFCYCQSLTSIVIPDNVKDLTIKEYAFAACNFMKDFTIGRGVKHMEQGALGTEVWYISGYPGTGGLNKFAVSTKLDNLYCPFDNPPLFDIMVPVWYDYYNPVDKNQYKYYLYHDCVLNVPVGSKEKYSNSTNWSDFKKIVEDPALSAIDKVELDRSGIRVEGGRIVAEGNVEVFDLGGRKVAEGLAENLPALPAGFYIVRTPNATAKVVL
ncbi:MAG: leucine-rich repeat domain-containing protein [Duncaniella sp.]|nr:leucine-rich repeat domain-containing protein [Duncaniella sp.]